MVGERNKGVCANDMQECLENVIVGGVASGNINARRKGCSACLGGMRVVGPLSTKKKLLHVSLPTERRLLHLSQERPQHRIRSR